MRIALGVVGLGGRGRGSRLFFGEPKNLSLEQGDSLLEVGEAGVLEALVGAGDEVFDFGLVFLEVGVDVGLVDDAGALGLGEDEVQEEDEADVCVEGDPISGKRLAIVSAVSTAAVVIVAFAGSRL